MIEEKEILVDSGKADRKIILSEEQKLALFREFARVIDRKLLFIAKDMIISGFNPAENHSMWGVTLIECKDLLQKWNDFVREN